MAADTVTNLDFYINAETDENIFQGAQEVLNVIRPTWQTNDIIYKMLSDGITNKLVRCKVKDGADHEAVLIRIYGNNTDMLIDRKAETRNIQMLNQFDMAPTLYATFKNGLAYEFVPGCTLTSKTASQPEIFLLVARQLAKLHKLNVANPTHTNTLPTNGILDKEAVLWSRFEKFLKLVPDQFSNEHVHKKFLNMKLSKAQISSEINTLKLRLSHLNSPVVFCHNDLLLGNVIYTKMLNNNKDKVTFIDFEYADFNYQGFDIGNHFAEFAGVDNVDYEFYPSKELQYAWLKEYAKEFHADDGDGVTDAMLDVLYVQVNQFALASHLVWGVWALVQAEHSDIDFDFIGYSSIRLTEYFSKKQAFLSLELPSLS